MTVAASNPALRVVRLIELLAQQPHRGFGLSEICRELGMSKGTCLGIATTLVEQGYLVQHAKTRAYRLGPALITLGQAVLGGFVDLRPGLRCLNEVAAEFDMGVAALAVDGDHLVVIERTAHPDPAYVMSRVGTRLPFAPPWGAPFVAWGGESDREAWLRRSLIPLPEETVVDLLRSLRAGRARGFFVTSDQPDGSEAGSDLRQLWLAPDNFGSAILRRLAHARFNEVGYFVDELKPDVGYPVNHVSVPVLASGGRVVVTLFAVLYGRRMTGTAIERLGTRMVETSRELADLLYRPRPTAGSAG